MKGYRVVKACGWKAHRWHPGGPPLAEPDLLAAGVHPDVLAHLERSGAFAPVELPDPPARVESPAASGVQAPGKSKLES